MLFGILRCQVTRKYSCKISLYYYSIYIFFWILRFLFSFSRCWLNMWLIFSLLYIMIWIKDQLFCQDFSIQLLAWSGVKCTLLFLLELDVFFLPMRTEHVKHYFGTHTHVNIWDGVRNMKPICFVWLVIY